MKISPDIIKEARFLLLKKDYGILSTLSVDVAGYPFGSVMPYCLNRKGEPVILIAAIAQHTKNIIADKKVSLTIIEDKEGNVQEQGRLTLLANAVKVEDELDQVSGRYLKYFPGSYNYSAAHDFDYYRLELVRIRYIGGFAKIYWLEADEFSVDNPFYGESEKRIIDHMNKDHRDALITYCSCYKNIKIIDPVKISMTGIDSEGFDLLWGQKKIRFNFNDPISTPEEARKALVQMVKDAQIKLKKQIL